MPNSSLNVNVGKPAIAGAIFRAPVGTSLPVDATTALTNDWVCVGYISADGVTNGNALDSENTKAWGGDVIYTMNNGRTDTWQFTMVESMNEEAMKVYFGDDNVTKDASGNITITVNSKDLGSHSYVIDEILRDNRAKRIVIPIGQVSATEDINYRDNEIISYGVTVTGALDSAGNTHYEYIAAA